MEWIINPASRVTNFAIGVIKYAIPTEIANWVKLPLIDSTACKMMLTIRFRTIISGLFSRYYVIGCLLCEIACLALVLLLFSLFYYVIETITTMWLQSLHFSNWCAFIRCNHWILCTSTRWLKWCSTLISIIIKTLHFFESSIERSQNL